jgi:hypothetical protein
MNRVHTVPTPCPHACPHTPPYPLESVDMPTDMRAHTAPLVPQCAPAPLAKWVGTLADE